MNILNLPDWDVYEIKEGEYDYVITARYIPEPVACIRCGVLGQLYRHGVKKQRFMDLQKMRQEIPAVACLSR